MFITSFFKSQFDMDEISPFYHLDSPKVRERILFANFLQETMT